MPYRKGAKQTFTVANMNSVDITIGYVQNILGASGLLIHAHDAALSGNVTLSGLPSITGAASVGTGLSPTFSGAVGSLNNATGGIFFAYQLASNLMVPFFYPAIRLLGNQVGADGAGGDTLILDIWPLFEYHGDSSRPFGENAV